MVNLGSSNAVHRLRYRLAHGDPTANIALSPIFDPLQRWSRTLKSSRVCAIDGDGGSIESHVLPRSYVNLLQSAFSKPVTPSLNARGAARVQWRDGATEPVFRGYCHRHDSSLFPWEKNQQFDGGTSVELQLMRVSDAFSQELRTRLEMLRRVALLRRHSPQFSRAFQALAPHVRAQLGEALDSAEAAVPEVEESAKSIADLADGFRWAIDPSTRSRPVYARHIRIPGPPHVQLADAAHLPRDSWARIDDLVPVAMCVLSEADVTHLLIGSNMAGKGVVERIADHLERDARDALAHVLHWQRNGSQYWFMRASTYGGLEPQDMETLKDSVRITPFVRAALYSTPGTPVLVPIVRRGNGWA